MVEQEKRHEYISMYSQGAENWRSKGNPVREARSLSSVLMNYLAIVVVQFDNVAGAMAWLAEHDALTFLSRYGEVLQCLATKVDAGEIPASTLSGNYSHLVFTHVAWSLGEFDLGKQFAGIATRSDVLEISTPFWQEYAEAVEALIKGQPYTIGDLAVQGQEKYWLANLRLIEQATNNRDTASAVGTVDDAFAERNSDNTIKDDAHEIEGSGGHPVHWNFRRDGLINYFENRFENRNVHPEK